MWTRYGRAAFSMPRLFLLFQVSAPLHDPGLRAIGASQGPVRLQLAGHRMPGSVGHPLPGREPTSLKRSHPEHGIPALNGGDARPDRHPNRFLEVEVIAKLGTGPRAVERPMERDRSF